MKLCLRGEVSVAFQTVQNTVSALGKYSFSATSVGNTQAESLAYLCSSARSG